MGKRHPLRSAGVEHAGLGVDHYAVQRRQGEKMDPCSDPATFGVRQLGTDLPASYELQRVRTDPVGIFRKDSGGPNIRQLQLPNYKDLVPEDAISGQKRPGAVTRKCTYRCTMGIRGPCYFVIENMKVFEIEQTPDGAAGLNVTNAECSLTPIRIGVFGMWMATRAWPFESITPR